MLPLNVHEGLRKASVWLGCFGIFTKTPLISNLQCTVKEDNNYDVNEI